jgi:hypothetical protein
VFYETNMLQEQFYVFILFEKAMGSCTHSASNKNSFYGEMKNDKLWQMETMNWNSVLPYVCFHKSWRRRQWQCGSERENVRMKWLYGSICNAIKWTLNMHNNPLLLSTSICQPVDSLSLKLVHTYTRMSWIAGKTIISLLLRYKIFFASLSLYFIFEQIELMKKELFYNSLPL